LEPADGGRGGMTLTAEDLFWLKRETYVEPEGAPPKDAKRAKACRCENPKTYRDPDDGDLRCLCGRVV
jgi:hypothetical protein